MSYACLEKSPRVEDVFCLQTSGHPGTHQAYVRDSLIEWEHLSVEGPVSLATDSSSNAA